MLPVDKVAPGVVAGKGHGSSFFGSARSTHNTDMANRIESIFQGAHLELHHDANIHKRIWEKVAYRHCLTANHAP